MVVTMLSLDLLRYEILSCGGLSAKIISIYAEFGKSTEWYSNNIVKNEKERWQDFINFFTNDLLNLVFLVINSLLWMVMVMMCSQVKVVQPLLVQLHPLYEKCRVLKKSLRKNNNGYAQFELDYVCDSPLIMVGYHN